MRDIGKEEEKYGKQDPLTFNWAAMPAPGSEEAEKERIKDGLLSCVRL